jgi:hypothetical protein
MCQACVIAGDGKEVRLLKIVYTVSTVHHDKGLG